MIERVISEATSFKLASGETILVEPHQQGLDRRCFVKRGSYYEWAYLLEVQEFGMTARWYTYMPDTLPAWLTV
jgi:hypothetical protein